MLLFKQKQLSLKPLKQLMYSQIKLLNKVLRMLKVKVKKGLNSRIKKDKLLNDYMKHFIIQ